MKKQFFLCIPLLMLSLALYSQQVNLGPNTFPQRIGVVNDYEDILSAAAEKKLEAAIKKQQKKTGDDIVIVTTSSIEPFESIETYANTLINHWKVGSDKRNGILIVMGKGIRKVRIETGSAIWDRFTDAEAKMVIDEVMIPEFKEGRHADGFSKALDAIGKELKK